MPVYKDKRKTKDNRQYYYSIHYVDSFGKSHRIQSKRYATKKEAEKQEAIKLLELDKIASDNMTFNQAANLFLADKEKRIRYSSFLFTKNALKYGLEIFGNTQINKLTTQQYQEFLVSLDNIKRNGKPVSNKFKNRAILTIKQLLDFTNKRFDLTSYVPTRFENFKNEDKKEMQFITHDEFKKFIDIVDDPVYKTLFLILFYMGLRIGEANGLQWSCIDFDKKLLYVKQQINTKLKDKEGNYVVSPPKTKSSIRTLPLPQIVSNALLELHDCYSKYDSFNDGWYVFGGYKPIPNSSIQKNKTDCFKKANVKEIRLHDFRHSCASYLINNGASPLLVSKWLGHSDITMTLNTYSHLYKSELEDVVNKINAENCW